MLITSITGKTKSDELTVTKSISTLVISFTNSFSALLNEKITIFIERANGNNVILANKIPLKDFIMSSSYGTENVQSDGTFGTIGVCELSEDGAIFLAEKESIKIQLDDLRAGYTYQLNGIEEPLATNNLFFWEQKTVASEEFSKVIDVNGFDLAIMTTSSTIQDISYRFENGQIVKYLPFELAVLSRDLDPIQYIDGNEVVQSIPDKLSLPLVAVDTIEINKQQGAVINFVMRTMKDVS